MHLRISLIAFALCATTHAQLPANYQLDRDWLLATDPPASTITEDKERNTVTLHNGLISRTIDLKSGTTVAFENLMTGETVIRAITPEGSVTIDGTTYPIGGLDGQPNRAFLTEEFLAGMRPTKNALTLIGHESGSTRPRMQWTRTRHHAPGAVWPPKGKYLRLDYMTPLEGIHVSVHYEIYDGLPVLQKWITVENKSGRTVNLDRFNAETLSVVERDSQVETRDGVSVPRPRILHVETDMAFGGMMHRNANRHTVHWRTEKSYTSQVNYRKETPCRLMVEPTFGPDQTIKDGDTFETFRVFELVHDSEDRERRGLALRRMYRTIAPWVTENPLMMHVVSSNPDVVRRAVDQAAEVRFEMVIISFGSGFNAENTDPAYLAKWKGIVDDAHAKGIQMGCYSLYSSRRIGGGNAIVPPEGMSCAHGNCPAITSEWGREYIRKLYNLFDTVGFDLFENDGPYPGDVDTTARPPLQKGVNDSRWVHWRTWTRFYGHLRDKGVYLNLPDYYYLSGSNKCGMGYREVNWSLPRAQQRIHTRQNIYDGTWQKTPSMGWMFVPLTQYHGGGAAATIEPLDQHRDHYEIMMLSNLGLGVQACYRGPRLYDTEATKGMVTNTVAWFRKHRNILESDLVHGRRADGRDLDWMLHVNPQLDTKGLLAVYNPTEREITRTIRVPLYYTGLKGTATVAREDGAPAKTILDAHQRARLTVTVPANGFSWFTFRN